MTDPSFDADFGWQTALTDNLRIADNLMMAPGPWAELRKLLSNGGTVGAPSSFNVRAVVADYAEAMRAAELLADTFATCVAILLVAEQRGHAALEQQVDASPGRLREAQAVLALGGGPKGDAR